MKSLGILLRIRKKAFSLLILLSWAALSISSCTYEWTIQSRAREAVNEIESFRREAGRLPKQGEVEIPSSITYDRKNDSIYQLWYAQQGEIRVYFSRRKRWEIKPDGFQE